MDIKNDRSVRKDRKVGEQKYNGTKTLRN